MYRSYLNENIKIIKTDCFKHISIPLTMCLVFEVYFKTSCWAFHESSHFFHYYIPLPFNILQGSQSSISKPSSSSSSVPQKVPTVVAATGTGSTSEQERKLKQYLDDERIALFLQNEEFMKELQRNREFLIALERGRKTLAHTLNGTMSSFWHTPLPLLSQFHLHKS